MYIPEFFVYFLASQPPMFIKYYYTYMVILFNQFTVAYWSHMMTSNWVNNGSGNGLWRDYFNQHNLLLLDPQEEISMKSWYNTFYKRLNFNMLQEFWPLCPEANELTLNVREPSYLGLRPGTPVLEVIFNKYLIFEFSTGNSFLLLGL